MDELVGFPALICRLDREHRVLDRGAPAVDHGLVRQLGTVPAPVPVHAEVPACERRDVHLAPGDLAHVHQQCPHHLSTQGWGRVAAIEKAMDGYGLDLVPDAKLYAS